MFHSMLAVFSTKMVIKTHTHKNYLLNYLGPFPNFHHFFIASLSRLLWSNSANKKYLDWSHERQLKTINIWEHVTNILGKKEDIFFAFPKWFTPNWSCILHSLFPEREVLKLSLSILHSNLGWNFWFINITSHMVRRQSGKWKKRFCGPTLWWWCWYWWLSKRIKSWTLSSWQCL